MTLQDIANLPMPKGDFHGHTIKGALRLLMLTLWEEKHLFDGKRPFGNSCWEGEFEAALVKGGVIHGCLDYGLLTDCDSNAANAIIERLIREIFA